MPSADAAPAEGDASATLCEVLLAGPPKLEYLVAHSKGSLVVAHALEHYVEDLEDDESALFERLRITTLGAVVGLLLIAVQRAGRRTAVPFGPFMLIASWASILGASGLGTVYLERIGA